MLARLADLFVLSPTTDRIPVEGKSRRVIDFEGGLFEVWIQRTGDSAEPDLFILKFVGTGGRAERANDHPADAWPDLATEIWSVNPPGYGTSGGRASLRWASCVASAAFLEISAAAGGNPLLVTGNSLGTMSALYVAARHEPDGLLLRNPVPLKQIVARRQSWWNFGLARSIAKQVPDELCSITNAEQAAAPSVFVTSGRDRVIPPAYQQMVLDAFGGEQQVMRLAEADHATLMTDDEQPAYEQTLAWLRRSIWAHHRQRTANVRTG
jgi:pimeloyl-ACP methyl ester carboxylesterase